MLIGSPVPRRPRTPAPPKPYQPPSFYTPGSTGADPLGAANNPAGPNLPGNTTPTPPVDYGKIAQSDPTYLAQVAQGQNQIGQVNYDYNDPSNPYNTVTRLSNLLKQNIQGINDNANAHGILFSGINAQSQSNEGEAGKQRSAAAQLAHDRAITNINDTLGVDLGAATSRAIQNMSGTLSGNQSTSGQQTGQQAAAKPTAPKKPSAPKAPKATGRSTSRGYSGNPKGGGL